MQDVRNADHFANVQELCYKYVLEQDKAKKMLINHYGEASQLLKGLVNDLVALSYQGKQVVVLCQEKNINIEEGMSYCEECWEQWLAEQGYWEEIEGENDTNGQ